MKATHNLFMHHVDQSKLSDLCALTGRDIEGTTTTTDAVFVLPEETETRIGAVRRSRLHVHASCLPI
jgi:hypothetical protein